ncbi:hypothetical protein J6590_055020 [Homalodisca vitripennis]|nr:hypothetical protein J6590_055020 [Homalodisca vitripennis]
MPFSCNVSRSSVECRPSKIGRIVLPLRAFRDGSLKQLQPEVRMRTDFIETTISSE